MLRYNILSKTYVQVTVIDHDYLEASEETFELLLQLR